MRIQEISGKAVTQLRNSGHVSTMLVLPFVALFSGLLLGYHAGTFLAAIKWCQPVSVLLLFGSLCLWLHAAGIIARRRLESKRSAEFGELWVFRLSVYHKQSNAARSAENVVEYLQRNTGCGQWLYDVSGHFYRFIPREDQAEARGAACEAVLQLLRCSISWSKPQFQLIMPDPIEF